MFTARGAVSNESAGKSDGEAGKSDGDKGKSDGEAGKSDGDKGKNVAACASRYLPPCRGK